VRVLLHACCGPCLLEPLDALAAEHEVTIAYANPNIHPPSEYRRRRDTLFAFAEAQGLGVVELSYDPVAWMRAVAGVERDPALRCRACFGLRLGMVARYAVEHGFDAVATTLTVSPYQDADAIREAGESAAREAGVAYLDTDFTERYPEATRRSRDLGMYRQNYCGCMLSELEAEAERAARKVARKAERDGG
jgi:predicted adenine nucleotide alpha hydrolase (AANH) superfamily ATPase